MIFFSLLRVFPTNLIFFPPSFNTPSSLPLPTLEAVSGSPFSKSSCFLVCFGSDFPSRFFGLPEGGRINPPPSPFPSLDSQTSLTHPPPLFFIVGDLAFFHPISSFIFILAMAPQCKRQGLLLFFPIRWASSPYRPPDSFRYLGSVCFIESFLLEFRHRVRP